MMKKSKGPHFNTQNEPPESIIDEAGDESFPASDPLAWNMGLKINHHLQFKSDLSHALMREHQLMKKVINAILPLTKNIQQTEEKIIAGLIYFLKNYVEEIHQQKEILLYQFFTQAKTKHEQVSEYLLKDLLNEHKFGKELLSDLQKLLSQAQPTSTENYVRLLNNIHHLYLTHIGKEEEYILPIIEQIDEASQQTLVNAFNKIDSHINKKQLNQLLELLTIHETT